ncbi:DNA-binding transcriptional repressor PuuR [Caulifigura coniformis]|uniref:DNA-binding transcriptional repressor PuuR n=1 Tax=Caulifigura coniformis TaxID=2527983 RepID=A0A517SIW5_9PLAN|nr:substrate-binding domain-containing protein [Caulifigura coniformis]QDT56078.1 DNA-binding transcriptional repressor PuuR [Caulifigura coniformis]
MTSANSGNRVRELRVQAGLTQAELADRAGISRTAVTAIEGDRLVPSVSAALAVAAALGTTVEVLFGNAPPQGGGEVWAWEPGSTPDRRWKAEIGGRTVLYPAGVMPMWTPLPDPSQCRPENTLVLACCDPAAGLLASQYAAATEFRLLVLPRSSRQAVEMVRNGFAHLAGIHLSTNDDPGRNGQVVADALGRDFRLLRITRWQEGVAVTPTARLRSVRSAMQSRLTWIGRDPGSGARQCLDRLLADRPAPRHIARDHRGVTEAVRSGWADAGICVQLASVEAGLDFLPVQEEAYDVCIPEALADDRRVKAFVSVVRSAAYRKLLGQLPGYTTQGTGDLQRS